MEAYFIHVGQHAALIGKENLGTDLWVEQAPAFQNQVLGRIYVELELTTSHPTTLGETIPGHVCFDETDALQNNCVVPTDIQITKCKDFFVYYLKQTELHWETRYCGTFN